MGHSFGDFFYGPRVGAIHVVFLSLEVRYALFYGVKEQNYIYHAIAEALGWTRAGKRKP